jgi:hypothetical protein
VRVAGETDLHKTLKKQACWWLYAAGYRCIAAEVRVAPVGIIDSVGTGVFRAYHNYLGLSRELPQACFIECKASRADYLRDHDESGQLTMNFGPRRKPARRRISSRNNLGKFRACLAHPLANLHYILSPVGMLQKCDLPARWGLLAFGPAGVTVVVRAQWQETARVEYVESAIARTLTGDIYRADERAMMSVNREIFMQQQSLAERIRKIRPGVVLSPAYVGHAATAPAAM